MLPGHELWPLREAATGRPREWLIAHREEPLPAGAQALLDRWIRLRQQGWPIAYLTGSREFYGRSFWVNAHTLIPRIETELLVDTALSALKKHPASSHSERRVCDLGTGSGCIATTLSLEMPGLRVTATDQSAHALTVARNNAAWLGASAQVQFFQGSWWEACDGRFHGVVSNPPYVAAGDVHLQRGDLRFEPATALTTGQPHDHGLDAIGAIVHGAPEHLISQGFLAIEHGHTQQDAVLGMFRSAGFIRCEGLRDSFGNPRVVIGWVQ